MKISNVAEFTLSKATILTIASGIMTIITSSCANIGNYDAVANLSLETICEIDIDHDDVERQLSQSKMRRSEADIYDQDLLTSACLDRASTFNNEQISAYSNLRKSIQSSDCGKLMSFKVAVDDIMSSGVVVDGAVVLTPEIGFYYADHLIQCGFGEHALSYYLRSSSQGYLKSTIAVREWGGLGVK